jgi:DNA-binding transcriptional MerR regulator
MEYLRIGDFAKIVGVNIKTIRFYEEKELINPAYVDRYTGYRYYDKNNIKRILEVLMFKEFGFSLKEIKNINSDSLISKTQSLKEKIIKIQDSIKVLESIIKKDDVMYKVFINDDDVIGKWERIKDENDFPFDEIYFLPNGKPYWVFEWTKGYLKISEEYHPYEINGDILKLSVVDINGHVGKVISYGRIDRKLYSINDIRVKDDLTYEFNIDEEAVGIWKAIKFIINDSPYEKRFNGNDIELFLKRLILKTDGSVIEEFSNGNMIIYERWTKGKIIDNKHSFTCSHYYIKTLNGEKQLHVEWKSGDYQFGKRIPGEYVLVKE